MLLKVKEAAEMLACSTKQVRHIIDSGKLKVVRLGKSARSDRVDESDLQEYIFENKGFQKKSQSIKGTASGMRTSNQKVDALSALLEKEKQKKKN